MFVYPAQPQITVGKSQKAIIKNCRPIAIFIKVKRK